MATIKITELTNIGSNLTSSTVIPVVNMSGTPTTEKTVLGNIANVVLAGAGGNYTAAAVSILAQSVTNAAQPNITSVGTLTNLVTSGNISGSNLIISNGSNLGNAARANYFVGTLYGTANVAQVAATVTTNAQPNITSVGTLTGLTVTATITGNITGSANTATTATTAGTVTTNAQPNITSVGTLTGVVSTGNVSTTGFFVGDGGFLTNVSGGGSNYSNSNVAAYLPTYNGNVLGLNVTGTTNSSSSTTGALKVTGGLGVQGNIHSGGEMHSSGNIDCNGNTIFVGPFADATGITGPVIVGFAAGDDYVQSVLKNSRGNGSADWTAVANEGDEDQGWVSLGMSGSIFSDPNFTITKPGDGYVLSAGLSGSGGNLVLGTGSTGNISDIVFSTGGFNEADEFARIDHLANTFHLTRAGAALKFPDNTIQTTAFTGSDANTGNITFDDIAVQGQGGQLFLSPDPDFTANLAYVRVRAGDVASHIHMDTGNNEAYDLFLGDDSKFVQASSTGNIIMSSYDSANATSYVWTLDTTGNLTIPGSIIGESTINIDNRDGGLATDINLYSGDDILLQARDRPAGDTNEGGDINIFAGDSAEDSDTSAGDIVIEAGVGGASNLDFGGAGGFVRVEAGRGGAAVGANFSARSGGSLTLSAGNAGGNNGNIDLGGSGGDVTINAGDSTGNGDPGGSIILRSGDAGANALAGQIQLIISSSDNGPGGTWTFDGEGIIQLPNSGTIGNDGNNIDIGSTSAISLEASTVVNIYTDTNTAAYQWQFGDNGQLILPTIELDVGNTINEQTVIQSQRKIIPQFRYSAVIDGSTPTAVYTASSIDITSMKVTMQIQHQSLGMEFFEVNATQSGNDTYYTVSNRLHPPGITDSTVVVDMNGSNIMEITVTINSGATASWVTYDAVEFGIPQD